MKRLLSHAVIAAAPIMTMFPGAITTQADIIVNSSNALAAGTTFDLTVGGLFLNGNVDLQIFENDNFTGTFHPPSTQSDAMRFWRVNGTDVFTQEPLNGVTVGAHSTFGDGSTGPSWLSLGSGNAGAVKGTDNYFGFLLDANDDDLGATHYGWGKLTLDGDGMATAFEWGIETTAGQSIAVGVPEPRGLSSVLFLAAIGHLLKRRRRRRSRSPCATACLRC